MLHRPVLFTSVTIGGIIDSAARTRGQVLTASFQLSGSAVALVVVYRFVLACSLEFVDIVRIYPAVFGRVRLAHR